MKIDLNDKITRFLVQEYVNQICHYQSKEELNFNVHKLIHTFTVVEMARKLIKQAKPVLSLKLQKQILNAALLHDLGRCREFKNGIHLKSIDHGKIGADLIKKYFPKMKVEAQSTLFHNKCPSNKDPKSAQPVLDYVRDADMLANLKYEIDHLDVFLIQIVGEDLNKISKPIIDAEILNAALEKRSANVSKIKEYNALTLFLWQLCWYFNLSTKAGKTLVKKMNLFINFKKTICQKIIPIIVQNKKNQKELIQMVQKTFPNEIFGK